MKVQERYNQRENQTVVSINLIVFKIMTMEERMGKEGKIELRNVVGHFGSERSSIEEANETWWQGSNQHCEKKTQREGHWESSGLCLTTCNTSIPYEPWFNFQLFLFCSSSLLMYLIQEFGLSRWKVSLVFSPFLNNCV